jgi:hypothetical protein
MLAWSIASRPRSKRMLRFCTRCRFADGLQSDADLGDCLGIDRSPGSFAEDERSEALGNGLLRPVKAGEGTPTANCTPIHAAELDISQRRVRFGGADLRLTKTPSTARNLRSRRNASPIDRCRSAGVLEKSTVDLMNDTSVRERLKREGFVCQDFEMRFGGRRLRVVRA